MEIDENKIREFENQTAFGKWLGQHHTKENEIWLKIYKKSSDIASINWEEAVIEAIAWGWIDGLKKSNDDNSWFQRLTPRKPKSGWSKRNCGHAEKLIADGKMQKTGLLAVEKAKADGRWDAAYSGSAEMEFPDDFLKAVSKNTEAKKTFNGLNRTNLFSIYLHLTTAKKQETRQKRMTKMIEMLSRGETFR